MTQMLPNNIRSQSSRWMHNVCTGNIIIIPDLHKIWIMSIRDADKTKYTIWWNIQMEGKINNFYTFHISFSIYTIFKFSVIWKCM